MTPRATYRLQLHAGFTFADAAALAPYLAGLGVSHAYLSPILTARAGSMHGYDVIDHRHINPELGGEAGFRALAAALRRHGLGIILDIVPNHMAVGADNPLWMDVLARGRASRYARWFDIDFDVDDPDLRGRVLLPVLGAPLDETLAQGLLQVVAGEDGRFMLACHERRFPLRDEDQPNIAASGLDRAQEGIAALLQRQHYRLAWWRTAGDRINYRRFFEINDLAGLRMEEPEAFAAAHAVTFDLWQEGLIDGVRVDHVDGLAAPASYCRALRQVLEDRALRRPEGLSRQPWIVVEKILGAGEQVPEDWGVAGTTGYDFMNEVSALQHDGAAAEPLSRLWSRLSGRPADFEPEESAARREVLQASFAGHLRRLAADLAALAPPGGDMTADAMGRALESVIAHLRVYRSYADGEGGPLGDGLAEAFAAARARPGAEPRALDLLEAVLAGNHEAPAGIRGALARRFSHLTAPVAAKAVEDTAFYRYGRLLSRNDVGFDPGRLACSTSEFHAAMARRARDWPGAMLATATHDHKRGEDVRARLAVLSEIPGDWAQAALGWLRADAAIGPEGLDPGDRHMLHQMIIGALPLALSPEDDVGPAGFAERLGGWWVKALREAKLRSGWAAPDAGYEEKAARYLHALLVGEAGATLRADMHRFAGEIAAAGAANGLMQAVLRCTLPGVPDLYQGTEFWDFSLVDPDNRRPVDYDARIAALAAAADPAALAASWRDGCVKQAMLARLLQFRQVHPALFDQGDYRVLEASGARRDHVLAFGRSVDGQSLVVVAGRHLAALLRGGDALAPPAGWWEDTGVGNGAKGRVPVAGLLKELPVAAWIEDADGRRIAAL